VEFVRYLQVLSEFTVIVTALALVFKYSGAVKWFHLAFLGVAVAAIYFLGHPIAMESITPDDQLRTEIGTANGLGFSGALGVFGALALWPEVKRLWVRGGIVAGGLLAFYAILLSASRSAFLALMVIAVSWPALCLVSTRRFKLTTMIGAGIVLLLAYGVYGFIMQETYLGNRLMQSAHMEDGSTQIRFELVRIGLQIFLSNPLFGCGLGQFSIVSGTGHYAHNEFIEIAATTGLPGLWLYYSVYVIAWRRLSRTLGVLQDPLVRYRINVARMALLVLVVLGLVSAPNFLNKPSMFMLATVVGIAHWAERMARQVYGCAPAGPGMAAAQSGFSGWPGPVEPGGWPGMAGGWGRR
jgi:O-antigen ligase